MSRCPVVIVIILLAVIMAGCGGGGGGSVGNAYPWCGLAGDVIQAGEKYSKAVESKGANILESQNAFWSAINQLENSARGSDDASRSALESLRNDARLLLDVQWHYERYRDGNQEAEERYRNAKDQFGEAKDTVAGVC